MKMSLKHKLKGKVITLVGNPAAGKTYLSEILKNELDAVVIYEQPSEGFPDEIKSNLKHQENLVDTILYFRNRQLDNHYKALDFASQGKVVIIDTPFYQHQLFVKLYIAKKFTQDVLFQMGDHDIRIQKLPDITIYIRTTAALVLEYLNKRYGEREWEETDWHRFISKMPPFVDEYINRIKGSLPNFIEIDRALYDFALPEDRENLFKLLDGVCNDFG